MRLAGVTWDRCARVSGYSARHCRQIYRDAVGRASGEMDIEAHRCRILGALIEIEEVFRPWALGYLDEIHEDEGPPDIQAANVLLKSLDHQRKLLGTDVPRQTSTTSWATQQIGSTPEGERIAERTQRLMELLKDHPLSDQEMLDIDSTEVSVPTSNSSGPLTNGHRSVDGNGDGGERPQGLP
jgi:hypothetical protein